MLRYLKDLIKIFLNKFNLDIKTINSKEKNYPIEATQFEIELIEKVNKFSMTGKNRMYSICQSVDYIRKNNIEGDFVECGVWKGGNLILLKNLADRYSLKDKFIYGYDTFEGMTEPSKFDVNVDREIASELLKKEKKIENEEKKNTWCYSGYESVLNNIKNNTSNSNLKLIKGDVLKTLKENENLPNKISLLRLDTDFYESTKIELEILFPKLSLGGVLIIDDYGHWKGSRKACDEYFKKIKFDPFFHIIDYSCRLIIK